MTNPAIHVAQFAAAGAAARNNQQHTTQNTEKQEITTPQIVACVSIILIVAIISIIIGYKMENNSRNFTGEYYKIRLNQIKKNLKRK